MTYGHEIEYRWYPVDWADQSTQRWVSRDPVLTIEDEYIAAKYRKDQSRRNQ